MITVEDLRRGVRAEIDRRRLTQNEAARQMGLSPATLCRFLSNGQYPSGLNCERMEAWCHGPEEAVPVRRPTRLQRAEARITVLEQENAALRGHLAQALRQWNMYANMHRDGTSEEPWLEESPAIDDAEAAMYREARAAIATEKGEG